MPKLKNAGSRVSKKCRSRNASTTNCLKRVSKPPTTSRIGMRMTTMKIERRSPSLRWLKNELRNEAIKEKDEVLEKKLWRWYYRAKDAEYEVDILVLSSDVRDMLKDAVARGVFDAELLNLILELVRKKAEEEAESSPPKEKKRKSKKKPPPADENLPKQKTLWD